MLGRALLGVALLLAVLPRGPSRPPPTFVPAPEAESTAITWVLQERPRRYDGRNMAREAKRNQGLLASWLGWVAYRRAYPGGPREPVLAPPAGDVRAWQEALQRIRFEVARRLQGGE